MWETKSHQIWSESLKASSWQNTAGTFHHKNKLNFLYFFTNFKRDSRYVFNGKVSIFWHECNILSLVSQMGGDPMGFMTKYWPKILDCFQIKVIGKSFSQVCWLRNFWEIFLKFFWNFYMSPDSKNFPFFICKFSFHKAKLTIKKQLPTCNFFWLYFIFVDITKLISGERK